jgi:allantoinase
LATFDLIIRNAKLLLGNEFAEVDICISEGKISRLQKDTRGFQAARSIDAKGNIVLPGLIDPHVHFRDPGLTHKEDFLSGSRGAAAGGVTTIFDMPTTQPVVTTAVQFKEKITVVKEKAQVNYGLIGAAGFENLGDLEGLAEAGAIAFKTYMVSPSPDRIKEYSGSYVTNSGQLYSVLKKTATTGLVHCIHAESDSTVNCLTEQMRSQGRKDPMAHYDSRPNFTEAEAVYDALLLSEVLGAKIHLVHVSTGEATDLLASAKHKGVNVSAETCPHYMLFTKEILNEKGPYAKYNPPARTTRDPPKLLNAINDGTISMIATDHAPHTKDEKEKGREDIFKAPPGTPGVETRLPLTLKMVKDGRLKLEDISKLTSEAAARRFGLYPRKGCIGEGSDADITIVDYDEEWQIKASELQTKAWETVLYDGMTVKGKVKYTVVNGEVAFEQGVGFSRPGIGSLVRGINS